MTTLLRGVIRAYNAGTHRADVQPVDSLPTNVLTLPVATDIPVALVVVGRECGVLLFTDDNPDDGVVVTVHNAVPPALSAGSRLQDADNDTFVDVEETADVDRVIYSALNGHRFTGSTVVDDDLIDMTNVGVIESNAGTDLIYLIPTVGTGYKTLTFPQGFRARKSAQIIPVSPGLGTLLVVQPEGNNALGSVTAVQGIAKSSGSGAGQTIRGLDYLVGVNIGSGSASKVSAIRAGLDVAGLGTLAVTDARLIEPYFSWTSTSAKPTTVWAYEVPLMTMGLGRRGFSCPDLTTAAVAGDDIRGLHIDAFDADPDGTQFPLNYGDVGAEKTFIRRDGSFRRTQFMTLGAVVDEIRSEATNDDPTESVYQNRVATTDATVTTLHTVTIPASTTVNIVAMVVARRTGGAAGTAEDGASYMVIATVKNVAGVATLIPAGTFLQLWAHESQAAWNATIDVTGATARVRVTGAASNDVTWHATVRVYMVSS